jgi:hypothetical protein
MNRLIYDGQPRLSIGGQTVHHMTHNAGFAEHAIVG